MFYLYICFNPINYLIASKLIANNKHTSLIVYEPKRITPTALPRTIHIKYNRRGCQLLFIIALLRMIRSAHIPHSNIHSNRLKKSLNYIAKKSIIDDGLDTIRKVPKNLILSDFVNGTEYATFRDYESFPDWMRQFKLIQVSHLKELNEAQKNTTNPFPAESHVLIESPGLPSTQIIEKLNEDGIKPLLIRHPAPEKQVRIDSKYQVTILTAMDELDASIAASLGVHFYIGESMTLIVGLATGAFSRNHLHTYLTRAQQDNLHIHDFSKTVHHPDTQSASRDN